MSATGTDPGAAGTYVRYAMDRAAQKVVQSVMLAAIARLAVLVALPLILGMLGWFATGFINLQQQAAVQAAEQARMVAEVRDLQDYRRDAYARGQRMQQEISTIREMLARIQNQLDRQPTRSN